MTEIVNKILKNKKEIMAKMDRLHILLLLAPSTELTKQLEYIEDFYVDTLEFLQNNLENNTPSVVNRLANDYDTTMSVLADIKEDLSKNLKLVSLLFIETLKGDILTYFYENLEELITKVNSVTYLPSYINEYKQEEVKLFFKKVLEYVNKYATEKERRLISIRYLEEGTTKNITNVKEWTELHKNINFTLKYISSDNEEAQAIKEAFWPLELYYLIMITLG